MRFPRYRKGLLLAVAAVLALSGIGVASAASGTTTARSAAAMADPLPGYDCGLVVTPPYDVAGGVEAPFKVSCPFAGDIFAIVALTYDGQKVGEDQKRLHGAPGVSVKAKGPAAARSVKVCANYLIGYLKPGSSQPYFNTDRACR